jgi:hypothetical protein
MSQMSEADADSSISAFRAAQRYQSGLMMALLAARPLRRGNFASIVLGRHLLATDTGYELVFAREETKSRTPAWNTHSRTSSSTNCSASSWEPPARSHPARPSKVEPRKRDAVDHGDKRNGSVTAHASRPPRQLRPRAFSCLLDLMQHRPRLTSSSRITARWRPQMS